MALIATCVGTSGYVRSGVEKRLYRRFQVTANDRWFRDGLRYSML
jgi:hypothetical protein